MSAAFRPPVSKESARLRLYLLGLVLDMWAMLASFFSSCIRLSRDISFGARILHRTELIISTTCSRP